MAEVLASAELERYLWGAAEYLRGTIDPSDYKQFIFPLLYFKRICDVFDEETALVVSEFGEEGAFFPESHRFLVPEGAHWNTVRSVTKDVGKAIKKAMREIEHANSGQLAEIFGDAPWTNKERLPDDLLKDLMEHFSSQSLSISHVPQDELGQGYEFLIKKFADDSGHTAAEFYTNRTLVRLMTLMLDPQEGESIYDPTCGSGGMLLVAALQLKEQGKEYRSLKLYGQDINLITYSIARMNLFLHGIDDFTIHRGDVFADPKFVVLDKLQQFDMVLANPPYSIKQWDRDAFTSDKYGRNLYGVPPQGRADYAFFQHIIKSLNPKTGRCAILFPHGVLFREDEQSMREKIVAEDIIECVLGLGPNLFYNSTMEACVIICRMQKPLERKGKILFIDAIDEVTLEKTQSFIEDSHREKILDVYHRFTDIEGFAKVVSLDDIQKQDSSLKINEYIRKNNRSSEEESLEELVNSWQRSGHHLHQALHLLKSALKGAGFHE
ncbi:MAG: class I SAM-dependent DNA methyltransferase [Methanobacteriota archaeon]